MRSNRVTGPTANMMFPLVVDFAASGVRATTKCQVLGFSTQTFTNPAPSPAPKRVGRRPMSSTSWPICTPLTRNSGSACRQRLAFTGNLHGLKTCSKRTFAVPGSHRSTGAISSIDHRQGRTVPADPLKKRSRKQPLAADVAELQTQLDTFAEHHNNERPQSESQGHDQRRPPCTASHLPMLTPHPHPGLGQRADVQMGATPTPDVLASSIASWTVTVLSIHVNPRPRRDAPDKRPPPCARRRRPRHGQNGNVERPDPAIDQEPDPATSRWRGCHGAHGHRPVVSGTEW